MAEILNEEGDRGNRDKLDGSPVVVQLEPDGRVTVRDHLSSESVHGQDSALVAVEVDEPVTRGLASELVGHHFDGDDAILPELGHGLPEKRLVHVRLEASDPKGADARHRKLVRGLPHSKKKNERKKQSLSKLISLFFSLYDFIQIHVIYVLYQVL